LAEIRTWRTGDYVVTTDPAAVDLDVVHRFLSEESYWALGRSREAQARANAMCTCFSVIHEPTAQYAGFARVLHDDVSFGWVADVFVLGTRDAHGVYAKIGFEPISRVDRWMEHWHEPPNP
jgi:hypothetical protein